jgi:3'-phosphoadenosine 5'-phosphosulfate sulfotransferase (PAPS reductase)/FAD synthetase
MELLDFNKYDKIIVSYSGGKDSTACVLSLLDLGVPKEKIELWHQAIDGMSPTQKSFFDWPSTEGYVNKVSEHLGLQLNWQWRAYGFYGEMNRENSLTRDIWYLHNNKLNILYTTKGKKTTRKKFPAKSPDLNKRWCSAYLKIDVCARVINNVIKGGKILFISGERREESPKRAKYKEVELHRTNTRQRLVHHFRPVIDWKEQSVWDIMERYQILPHPVYYLGFPRLSCRSCIFFTPDHWSTLNDVDSKVTQILSSVEEEFGYKLDNKYTIPEMIALGKSKITESNRHWIYKAVNSFTDNISTTKWELPAGAFGTGGGSI